MKKIILFLLTALVLNVTAQKEVSYEFDIKTEENSKQRPPDPMGLYEDYVIEIGDYVYVSFFNGIDLSYDIEKFDKKTNKKIDTKKISLDGLPKMYYFEGVFSLKNGKSYFKYSYWDKPNKMEQLFLLEIDMENGKFIGDKKLILESSKISNLPFWQGPYGISFAFKFPHFISQDETNLIVYYKKEPKSKNDSKNIDEIELVHLDQDFEILSKETFFMPKVESFIKIKEYLWFQDNLLVLIEDEDPSAKFNFALLKLDSETKSTSRIDLEIKDKVFHHNHIRISNKRMLSIGYDNGRSRDVQNVKGPAVKSNTPFYKIVDNNLYVYGYCYDKNTKEDALYLFKIGEDLNVEIKIHNYEKNYISNYIQSLRKERYIVNHSLNVDENSITVVGEVYGFKAEIDVYKAGRSLGMSSLSTLYNYYKCPQDIIINKFDLDLKPIWQTKIPKNQFGDLNTSFALTKKGGNYYFFYINHLDNLERSLEEKPKEYTMDRDGNLELAIVDENGKITRKALLRLQTEGIKVFPAKSSFDDDNNLIIDAKKDGKEAFIKILID